MKRLLLLVTLVITIRIVKSETTEIYNLSTSSDQTPNTTTNNTLTDQDEDETEEESYFYESDDASNSKYDLTCHVCSWYPGVKWSVDEDCKETVKGDKYARNCSEILNITKPGFEYRCRRTVGIGMGEKPFYIRSCSVSQSNKSIGSMIDYDLAVTSYCVAPDNCNASPMVSSITNHIYFMVLIATLFFKTFVHIG